MVMLSAERVTQELGISRCNLERIARIHGLTRHRNEKSNEYDPENVNQLRIGMGVYRHLGKDRMQELYVLIQEDSTSAFLHEYFDNIPCPNLLLAADFYKGERGKSLSNAVIQAINDSDFLLPGELKSRLKLSSRTVVHGLFQAELLRTEIVGGVNLTLLESLLGYIGEERAGKPFYDSTQAQEELRKQGLEMSTDRIRRIARGEELGMHINPTKGINPQKGSDERIYGHLRFTLDEINAIASTARKYNGSRSSRI